MNKINALSYRQPFRFSQLQEREALFILLNHTVINYHYLKYSQIKTGKVEATGNIKTIKPVMGKLTRH